VEKSARRRSEYTAAQPPTSRVADEHQFTQTIQRVVSAHIVTLDGAQRGYDSSGKKI